MNLFENKRNMAIINTALLVVLGGSMIANQVLAGKTKQQLGIYSQSVFANFIKKFGENTKLSGNIGEDAVKLAYAQGIPDIYGAELAVNFDDVQNSMNIMKRFDLGYGNNKPSLTIEEMKRYTSVNLRISCEFCCGAKAIVSETGEASCGCAHSQAMRGLTAYLIKNHGAKYTDDEILRELARWKGKYFPKQMVKKMSDQLQSGNYTPDIASLLLNMKLPKYSADSKSAPLPSEINNADSMVGGC
mgnify:FL=1